MPGQGQYGCGSVDTGLVTVTVSHDLDLTATVQQHGVVMSFDGTIVIRQSTPQDVQVA
jgi:hypothetical protein